ncbi:MAG: ThuA domain-containing protein [Sandaracinobacteroides sp.]
MTATARAVILSGGYAHPFAETSAVVAGLAAEAGLPAEIHTDTAAALQALPGAQLLVVNALWWSMRQDPKYAPHREAHARELADADLAAIVQHVEGGGSLLALHTATICWDTQPGWRALMGGGWTWGHSHHPPLGPVSVSLTEAGARLSDGPTGFDLVDETYHALDPDQHCTIRAHGSAGGAAQPIAWTRPFGAGRVAVDALGHDVRSMCEPGHMALLRGLIGWLAAGGADGSH